MTAGFQIWFVAGKLKGRARHSVRAFLNRRRRARSDAPCQNYFTSSFENASFSPFDCGSLATGILAFPDVGGAGGFTGLIIPDAWSDSSSSPSILRGFFPRLLRGSGLIMTLMPRPMSLGGKSG